MTNNNNESNETSILGVANIEFEAKISSKEFINKFSGNAFRNATMTIYNQDEEEMEIDVTSFIINLMREYEDQDDFGGEIKILGGIELNELMYVILKSVQKGDYLKHGDIKDLSVEDYNQAVDFIVSDDLVKNGVVVRGGIGGKIVIANLANATITKKGIDFLFEYEAKWPFNKHLIWGASQLLKESKNPQQINTESN